MFRSVRSNYIVEIIEDETSHNYDGRQASDIKMNRKLIENEIKMNWKWTKNKIENGFWN